MIPYSNELDFISIIVPTLNRFHYLDGMINSIHKHADMPFELIIHDDCSNDGAREKMLSSMSDKVSSIILNYGIPLGLSEAINRCVGIAGSRYILMFNQDMELTGPVLRNIFNTLKNDFVGVVYPYVSDENNKHSFRLLNGFGAGCSMAWRKDVHYKVGGWDRNTVCTSNSDVSFICRVFTAGYFPACPSYPRGFVRNISQETMACKDTTVKGSGYCSLPKIFNVDNNLYCAKNELRYQICLDGMGKSYVANAGMTNIDYWHNYLNSMISSDGTVNWEKSRLHGQIKWKDMVEKSELCRKE